MQLEAVSAITMSHLFFESLGQVNDLDCLEGAALNTHTTSDTQVLRDEADFGRRSDFDAHFTGLVDWASLLALLPALLGFALIWVNNCDSELLICHISSFFLQLSRLGV